VGRPSGRIEAAEHVLAGILARHFFVEVIWVPHYVPSEGRRGRVLEICGTLSNLEVAAYVHGFLLETAERLWREHRRRHGIASNRERRRFMTGVMIGFDEKLKAALPRAGARVWCGWAIPRWPAICASAIRAPPAVQASASTGPKAYEHGRKAGREIRVATADPREQRKGRLLGPVR